MPATYRFPVLVWHDLAGNYTASLVEWNESPAVAPSRANALEQLREHVSAMYEEQPWRPAPEFQQAHLLRLPVLVRPEYRAEGHVYPCAEDVSLRVWVVRGESEHGHYLAALPTLKIRFHFHDLQALADLVVHYVTNTLQGLTPRELALRLPPPDAWLDEVVVKVPTRTRAQVETNPLPALSAIAEALDDRQLRRQFGRAWERDSEVATAVARLGQERANVLLVGEAGSGKTTVLVEAVNRLHRAWSTQPSGRSSIPPRRRFWLTNTQRLIAGMKYLGQWEQRCEEVIQELARFDGVLCCDNLLDLVRSPSRSPHNSLAAFLLPYLQRGELRLVSEATPAELDACRRLLPGFADVFQVIALAPLERQRAVAVLDHQAQSRSQSSHIQITRGVTDLVYHLFHRFAPYHVFPGKAIQFIDDVIESAGQGKLVKVGLAEVVAQFIRATGLPEVFLRDELGLDRSQIVEAFRQQVMGQEEAVQAAADLVTTFKAGLNDPGRPVGVLLFCGPTGVGKTEMARALARFFFSHSTADQDRSRLVRLDMSEFTGPGAAERLLHQPDGEPSYWIRRLRQQPFCVVLLDEIEKADPQVFDVLLSVFDEGRLTDRYGRVTSLRSAVMIMTSNLGAGREQSFGFGTQAPWPYAAEVRSFFRPEFVNRIDAIVTFRPLDAQTILAITRKELFEVGQREGISRRRLQLIWTERLVEEIARVGIDDRYGARPLQRKVDSLIMTPLARFLLEHADLHDVNLEIDSGPNGEIRIRAASR